MPIIEVENLRKEYKINERGEGLKGAIVNLFNPKYVTKVAVNNINFSIDQGEMVGYIGANGAGKSTTIKMLTGILTPTSGKVSVNGIIPYKNRIKNNMQIGAVFGQRTQLWWDIPVIESYKLLQKIYEVPIDTHKKNLDMFIEFLDLKDLLKVPVRQLSLGQKMRCEIAAAFLHNPKIVYLDEPTIGLDFMVKEKIREFIKTLNQETGATVILTTHDLQDIEEICSRIIIIDKGDIMFDGALAEIKNKFGDECVISFKVKNVNSALQEILNGKPESICILTFEPHNIELKFTKKQIPVAEVISLVASYSDILDISINEASIDTIVKELFSQVGVI